MRGTPCERKTKSVSGEKWEVCVRGYRKESKKVGGQGEKSIYYSRANSVRRGITKWNIEQSI